MLENRVVGCLDPFGVARVDATVAAGATVAEMVMAAGADPLLMTHGHAWLVDGAMEREPVPVPRQLWERVRPKPGMTLVVRLVPHGGGGEGGKNPLRTILSIAVIAASFAVGAGVAGLKIGASINGVNILGAVAGAAASMVGNAIINAVAPAPRPRFSGGGAGGGLERSSPTYGITGATNAANPYGPVPVVFGRHLVHPPLGAETFSELVGNDQYFRMLLVLMGPVKISDIKIKETPIGDFVGVETEIREGWPGDAPLTLYSNDVHEEALSIHLTAAGGWQTRTTVAAIDEITIDVAFPGGLANITGTDSRSPTTVALDMEMLQLPSGSWQEPATFGATEGIGAGGVITVTDNSTSAVRRGARVKVPQGQYQVRLRRSTADSTSSQIFDKSYWGSLRSIKATDPVKVSGVAKIALRIKATEQFSGIIDRVNCIAESYLQVYDPGPQTWSWQVSRNPAWAYVHALISAANKRAVPTSRLNLTNIVAWANANDVLDQNGEPWWTFDAVYDFGTTVQECLIDIAACARARPGMPEGLHGVIRDVKQTVPVDHITPRNSWGFRASKSWVTQPHGLKVQFVDPNSGWQRVEITAYQDGYDASNASVFETMQIFGAARSSQAWREGRYRLADGLLRPETYEVDRDIEFVPFQRGDLVRLSHDVIEVGLAQGRISAVSLDGGGNATDVTLDETVTMESAKTYGLRIARAPGGSVYTAVDTVAGDTLTLTFPVPIIPANAPEVGDLALFGETSQESIPCIVKEIFPKGDMTARMVLVNAADAVHDADTGAIPAFNPQITLPSADSRRPAPPSIALVASDETVLVALPGGGWQPRIFISLEPRRSGDFALDYLEVSARRADTQAWSLLARRAPDAREVAIDEVQEGVAFDVRLRVVTVNGLASDFAEVLGHTVIGRSTPPPDIAGVVIENGAATWLYPTPPVDHAGFEVWHRPGLERTLNGAVKAHEGILGNPPFPIGHLPVGVRTVMVVAIDDAGNRSSPATAAVTIGLGDPVTGNVVVTIDLAALGFPGTIVNGSVAGGVLKADNEGALYLPDGAALYLPTGTDLYLPVSYKAMTWTTSFTPPIDAVPATAVIAATVSGDGWNIEYATDDQSLYLPIGTDLYLPVGSALYLGVTTPFVPWPGSLAVVHQRYDLRITTAAGNTEGKVSAFAVKVDVPDVDELLTNVAVVATGTRLPIAKSYRAITNLNLTVLDDAGTAVSAKPIDYDAGLGPLIKTFDGSHVAVTGTVNAHIQGY